MRPFFPPLPAPRHPGFYRETPRGSSAFVPPEKDKIVPGKLLLHPSAFFPADAFEGRKKFSRCKEAPVSRSGDWDSARLPGSVRSGRSRSPRESKRLRDAEANFWES